MIPLNLSAPVTDAEQAADLITHLNNGGVFYLPVEAVILLISAALVSAAAVLFLISSRVKKENKDK